MVWGNRNGDAASINHAARRDTFYHTLVAPGDQGAQATSELCTCFDSLAPCPPLLPLPSRAAKNSCGIPIANVLHSAHAALQRSLFEKLNRKPLAFSC